MPRAFGRFGDDRQHRDLPALFHELAGRLQQVVRFDYLGLLLHEAESSTLRLHVLEPAGPLPWPGNVRELQNVIERAVILSPGPTLQVPLADLPAPEPLTPAPAAAAVTLVAAEREHILGALRETGWVLGGPKGAAARLGMKRSTLSKKMEKFGISKPE